MQHAKRLKISENCEKLDINYQFTKKSVYYGATSKASPDERENSDSGFTECSTISDRDVSLDACGTSSMASNGTVERPQFCDDDDETIRDVNMIGPLPFEGPPPDPSDEYAEYDEDDDDDSSSVVSRLSGLSHLSDCDDTGGILPGNPWIRKQIQNGVSPRDLLSQMIQSSDVIPQHVSDLTLWRIIASTLVEPRRQKLRDYHSLDHAMDLIKNANNIIVLTGAGVSVSCGIPDFRSKDGIYSRLAQEYPNLPDPQAMFDIQFFQKDPRPFFKFAKEIYPGQFRPSPCHMFIKQLEQKGKLLRNYTQNIDTLEKVAGIRNVIECHGSFATASCTRCKTKVLAESIREDVFNQRIPLCQTCNPGATSPEPTVLGENVELTKELVERGIMKPDIVFFGEGLPEVFHETIERDRDKCDLLIVIGSSLKVKPVAMIPNWLAPNVPQILINREPLYHMDTFDINLLGDSDAITRHLCSSLGEEWTSIEDLVSTPLNECSELLPETEPEVKLDESSSSDEKNQTIERLEIDTVVTETKTETPSSSSNEVLSQTETTVTVAQENEVTTAVIEDTCDNLPSDEDDASSCDEFEFKRKRQSLAERLPPNSFYKLAPRVFIFPGAEVYMDDEDDDDSGSCADVDENDTIITPEEVAEINGTNSLMSTPPSSTDLPNPSAETTTPTDNPSNN
ncbi:NAD-dependent protein deacetylase sirtuin-1 [Culicoides brevitarsis]|uniref:NAD-dependent protein deacetylase sirtuin-1 n=1 Tax=Culicoides brevitarsis TaxID=469753 RepID=UPI00307B1BDB